MTLTYFLKLPTHLNKLAVKKFKKLNFCVAGKFAMNLMYVLKLIYLFEWLTFVLFFNSKPLCCEVSYVGVCTKSVEGSLINRTFLASHNEINLTI